jgi:hypothetical protein
MCVCCECCVLSGRGLCDGLITRPEESYRLWRVVVGDQETSTNEEAKARYRAVENTTTMGCNARIKTNKQSTNQGQNPRVCINKRGCGETIGQFKKMDASYSCPPTQFDR